MKNKIILLICVLVLICLTLVCCKKSYDPNTESEKALGAYESGSVIEHHKIKSFELRDSDAAEMISYDYQDRSMYIAGLKVFKEFSTEEFGFKNEGTVLLITDENALEFGMTTATGTVTGAVDGPHVYFKMNMDTNEIIEKEFKPAPNYAELEMPEFIEHSEEVIELTDERMIEIGVYFKELILKIEADSNVAETISYDYHNRSMYVDGLKAFKEFSTEEFGFENEGNVLITTDKNTLEFGMTTVTGATDSVVNGTYIYFKMNMDTNEIIEKEFKPAPNYSELGKTESIEHSEEVIELTDERMAEIGVYFKRLILKIESEGKY